MKVMNKITVALIALFCVGNLGALTWNFTNKTDRTLVIKFGLQAHPHWYYNIVKPDESVQFIFGGGLALFHMHSFQWAEYNPNIKMTKAQTKGEIETQNGGLDVLENVRKQNGTHMGREFGWLSYQYKDPQITPESKSVFSSSCVNAGCKFMIYKDNQGNIVFVAHP